MKKIIVTNCKPLEYYIPENIDELILGADGELVEITDSEYLLLKRREVCIFESGKVVPDTARKNYLKKLCEIDDIKAKLAATDYKAIKFAEQDISAEEYAPIKALRSEYRSKINALETDAKAMKLNIQL